MSEPFSGGKAFGSLDRQLPRICDLVSRAGVDIGQAFDSDLHLFLVGIQARVGGEVPSDGIEAERLRTLSLLRARNVLGEALRAIDRALALARVVSLDVGLDDPIRTASERYRVRALIEGLELAQSLANALVTRDHERSELLDRGLTNDYDLGMDRYLVDSLHLAVRGASAQVLALKSLTPIRLTSVARAEVLAGRWPVRLARLSVLVLPAGERGRYAEEFGSELFEQRSEPRRRQLIYATRLFFRSFTLSWALRRPSSGATARQKVW